MPYILYVGLSILNFSEEIDERKSVTFLIVNTILKYAWDFFWIPSSRSIGWFTAH